MGVFIDYTLGAEGPEHEIRRRMENVRRRCLDLPLEAVGEVMRMEPIYNSMILHMFQSRGNVLPPAVAERIRLAEDDADYRQNMISFGVLLAAKMPSDWMDRYLAPVLEMLDGTHPWKSEEMPEKIEETTFGLTTLSFNRRTIEFELASALLCHGYMLIIYPGEGSESVDLGLCTFRRLDGREEDSQVWYGNSFTKTQYAKNFIQVHETVCRVLDIVQEEGLLLKGSDTCGYYAGRSWKEAGPQVNEELIAAKMVSGMIDVGIGNLREAGISVQVIEDNAATARPVDFSSRLKREEEAKGNDDAPE